MRRDPKRVYEVDLVYLRPGERAPRSPKPIIVDCSKKRGGATMTDSEKEMVITVPYSELESTVAGLAEKGAKKIYIRGMEKVFGPR